MYAFRLHKKLTNLQPSTDFNEQQTQEFNRRAIREENKPRLPSLTQKRPDSATFQQVNIKNLNLLDKKYQKEILEKNDKAQRAKDPNSFNEKKSYKLISLNNLLSHKLTVLEGYTIGGVIGKGSYAIVKSAQCQDTKKKVAIKIYDKIKLHDPMKKKNVEREISIVKKLDHPNVVKLIRTVDTNSQLCLIMEYGGQLSLKEYVKQQGGKLKDTEAKEIMKQIFSALSYIHQQGIIHRDIKLDNILLDEQKRVKIIDFGFAILLEPGKKIKIFCGTPSYMAPEIVQKTVSYSTAVDIWACGVILFFLLSGSLPFKGKNEKELFKKIELGLFQKGGLDSQGGLNLIEKLLNINQNNRVNANQAMQDTWITPIDIRNQILEIKRYQYLLQNNTLITNELIK